MHRDTDEWRRPWTADDEVRPATSTDGATSTPPRVRRVVRPAASTIRPAGPTAAAERASAGAVAGAEVDGAPVDSGTTPVDGAAASSGTAVDQRAVGTSPVRTVTVRADAPGGAGAPPSAPPQGAGDGGRRRGLLPVALVAALVGGVSGAGATLLATDGLDDPAPAARTVEEDAVRAPVVESLPVPDGSTTVATVAAAVLPSVVRIDVLAEEDGPELRQIGVGSGVVYRSDGFLLTNNHVIEDADALEVQFSDGTVADAEVVGTDPLTDLAVLRVDREGLPAINLRQDRALEVGEVAVAIGSPFGLDASVTAGVVSALNRDLQVPGDGEGAFVIPALIQTDAAINPGNSGGALVDASGQLIGINTAILTGSGGSQGVGFAIPTRSAVIAAEQLIERGFVSHPFLGISGLDVTGEVEARYREEFGIDLDGGALVDTVVDGSGAAEGGVQSGDVIVELGGEAITSMTDVIAAILRFDPGDVVDVVVLRDGQREVLQVELGERPR